jgi:hypothetical protein
MFGEIDDHEVHVAGGHGDEFEAVQRFGPGASCREAKEPGDRSEGGTLDQDGKDHREKTRLKMSWLPGKLAAAG